MNQSFTDSSLPTYTIAAESRDRFGWLVWLSFMLLIGVVSAFLWDALMTPLAPTVVMAPPITPDPYGPTIVAQLGLVLATETATPTRTPPPVQPTRTPTPPVTEKYPVCGSGTGGRCVMPTSTPRPALEPPTRVPTSTIPACPTTVQVPGYPSERMCEEGVSE